MKQLPAENIIQLAIAWVKGDVWRLFLSFLAVVGIVARSGFHFFLEGGNTGLYENVIPLDELLNVAIVNTLSVEFGQYLGKVFAKLVTTCLAEVDTCGFSLFEVTHICEHLPKGHIVGVGVHRDVGKRCYTVGCECGDSLVGVVECFDNETVGGP